MFKNFYKNKYKLGIVMPDKETGLTLVELLVVVSIFMVITGITIFNYNGFNSSILTQNLADDIALTIRRVQGYATGVHTLDFVNNGGYGLHFDSEKSFILFVDRNDSKTYDNNNNVECGSFQSEYDECMEILSIESFDKIEEISLDGTILEAGDNLDITFKRPNPEPFFYHNNLPSSAVFAKIKISNNNNPDSIVTRYITISNTGQISVSIK